MAIICYVLPGSLYTELLWLARFSTEPCDGFRPTRFFFLCCCWCLREASPPAWKLGCSEVARRTLTPGPCDEAFVMLRSSHGGLESSFSCGSAAWYVFKARW